jgi:hypothetical protein
MNLLLIIPLALALLSPSARAVMSPSQSDGQYPYLVAGILERESSSQCLVLRVEDRELFLLENYGASMSAIRSRLRPQPGRQAPAPVTTSTVCPPTPSLPGGMMTSAAADSSSKRSITANPCGPSRSDDSTWSEGPASSPATTSSSPETCFSRSASRSRSARPTTVSTRPEWNAVPTPRSPS